MNAFNLLTRLNDGICHSGEALAKEMKISRAAIWKQISKLETMGISIERVHGKGYRLIEPLDLLSSAKILANLSPEVQTSIQQLFILPQVSSSNDFMAERFIKHAGHAEVCLPEWQQAARGRRGRPFQLMFGQGLALTLGWRIDAARINLGNFSLVVGAALAQCLQQMGVEAKLKWPNDLILQLEDQRWVKLGGILTEIHGQLEGFCHLVIGIGMNVHKAPAPLDSSASIAPGSSPVLSALGRNFLAARLIESLCRLLGDFAPETIEHYLNLWHRFHAFHNQWVEVHHDSEVIIAKILALNADGRLLLEDERQQQHQFSADQVSLRPQMLKT